MLSGLFYAEHDYLFRNTAKNRYLTYCFYPAFVSCPVSQSLLTGRGLDRLHCQSIRLLCNSLLFRIRLTGCEKGNKEKTYILIHIV